MNKRNILVLFIIVILALVGFVSAYFLMQPQYETFENEYFSVNVTKGSTNFVSNITENNSIRTYVYTNGNNQGEGYININIFDANNTDSLDQLAASTNINNLETEWASYLMNDNEHDMDGKVYKITNKSADKVVYSYVIKTYESDSVYIILTADNLDTLKVMVESFKIKQLKQSNKNNNEDTAVKSTKTSTKSNSKDKYDQYLEDAYNDPRVEGPENVLSKKEFYEYGQDEYYQ